MRLKESLEGIHPDKLVGVLRRHLADGRRDAVRQALPALTERHPSLAPELEAMRESLRLAGGGLAPDAGPSRADARRATASDTAVPGSAARDAAARHDIELVAGDGAAVFACASCGGTLMRQSPESIEVICQYCGNETTLTDELPGARWEATLDPEARFGIGSFFELDGTRWQVVGMQRFEGKLREWDHEDGVWETNRADWTSWWMLNGGRELAFLEDHGESRYWSVATVPKDPHPPNAVSRAHEHGDWTLVDAAGEFSYRVRLGERHTSVEPASGRERVTIETRLDEHGRALEIEYFRSRKLSDRDVLEGLGDAETIASIGRWTRTRTVFALAAMAALLMRVLLGVALPERELLAEGFDVVPGAASVPVASVTLDEPYPVYRIETSTAELRGDGWIAFELEFEAPDAEGFAYLPFELWRESGWDADEFWSESELEPGQRVRLGEPGRYALSAVGAQASEADRATPAVLRIVANAFTVQPMLFAALLAFGLAAVSQMRAVAVAGSGASLPPVRPSRRGSAGRRGAVELPA